MKTLLSALPLVALVTIASALFGGCSRGPELGGRIAASRERDAEANEAATSTDPSFDFALPPPGVPDRGRTLGLVVIEVGLAARCTAALVASNVAVLPARCVSSPSCAPLGVGDVAVRSSDDDRADLGPVRAILTPDEGACDPFALAAIVLARHADGLAPLALRARPAARGELGRLVALADGACLDRDHLRVEASSRTGLALPAGDGPVSPGAAFVDEGTGELLAVGAFAAASAEDEIHLLGIDRARSVIEAAIGVARSPLELADGGVVDAGVPRRGKPARPTLDLGAPCAGGADCAAGVCVLGPDASGYCSRPCGPGDRCPVGLRCVSAGEGRAACIHSESG